MELKVLIRNTYHLASAKFVRMIIGIFRAKLNALFLGTIGVGIVSQVLFASGRFREITILGMNDGLVKQLASRKSLVDFRSQLLNSVKSYMVIVFFTTILVIGLSFLFAERITIYFFGDEKYYNYYLVSLVCLPIAIINSVSFAVLKSFKLIDKMAKAELIGAISSFALFVPLVYFFRLNGAVAVIIINLVIMLGLNHFYSKKSILDKYKITYWQAIKKGRIVKSDIKELAIFGGYGLTLGLYMMLIVIVKRSVLIENLGISSLGLYAPNIAWGGLYTGMVLPTIRHYLYPRFAELKHDNQIVGLINDAFRMSTFFMIPFLFGGIAFSKIIIPIFYSYEFIDAANYIPGHFLGMLFFMWSQIMIMVYTPTGRIRIYVIIQFATQSIFLGLTFYLIPKFGLYGYMITFIYEPFVFVIISFIYLHNKIGFRLLKQNSIIGLYVLASSFLLYGICQWNNLAGYVLSAILFLNAWNLLWKSEKEQIIARLARLLKINR